MSSIYESVVDPLRPNDAHGFALQMIGSGKSVLELGAASGHVTKVLVSMGNTVTAVERDGRFAETLSSITDDVIVTDLDWLDLRQVTDGRKFDVVLAGDVLEHCPRPDLVALQCHSLLNDGGFVVVSIPNIAHGDVRLALLAGKFDYRQSGLLDQTHVRFFTRASLERFVSSVGFRITEIFASTAPVGGTEFGPPEADIPREAIAYVQADRDHVVYQYIARLEPVPGFHLPELSPPATDTLERLLAEVSLTQEALQAVTMQWRNEHGTADKESASVSAHLSELELQLSVAQLELTTYRDQLAASQDQLAASQDQLAASQDQLAASQDQLAASQDQLHVQEDEISALTDETKSLQLQLLGARDFAIGAAAELGEMRHRHDMARVQIDSLVHQINLIHGSRTWRIGRFVLRPLRGIQWVLRKLRG